MLKKTVCLVHGVGKHVSIDNVLEFGNRLRSLIDIEYIAYKWNHPGTFPLDPRSTGLFFGSFRDFTWEVIMDFVYSVREFDAGAIAVPDADFYIGHSAGGILAMARPVKPCMIMGSPLQLIEYVKPMLMLRATTSNVLNVLHNQDPIASPLLGCVNEYYDNGQWYERINPIAAHTQYWKSWKIVRLAANWFNKTVNDEDK